MGGNFRKFISTPLDRLRVVEGQINYTYDAPISMPGLIYRTNNRRATFNLILEPCETGFGDFEEWLDAYGITPLDLSITKYRVEGCVPKHIMEGDLRKAPKINKDSLYWRRFVKFNEYTSEHAIDPSNLSKRITDEPITGGEERWKPSRTYPHSGFDNLVVRQQGEYALNIGLKGSPHKRTISLPCNTGQAVKIQNLSDISGLDTDGEERHLK